MVFHLEADKTSLIDDNEVWDAVSGVRGGVFTKAFDFGVEVACGWVFPKEVIFDSKVVANGGFDLGFCGMKDGGFFSLHGKAKG